MVIARGQTLLMRCHRSNVRNSLGYPNAPINDAELPILYFYGVLGLEEQDAGIIYHRVHQACRRRCPIDTSKVNLIVPAYSRVSAYRNRMIYFLPSLARRRSDITDAEK